jgi:histone deacetylase complex regulatory component SIN3
MKYEVRYQIGGEEQTAEVDVDDAASAVQLVQERFQDSSEVFELIQVHLLEDFPSQEIEVEATN